MIFFWESDSGQQTPAGPGVRPVFGRGIWEREVLRNQSAYLCVCVRLNGRSYYNIGLCCGERWSPAVARYSTALHLQQSKQKHTGVDEASQAQPGHKTS